MARCPGQREAITREAPLITGAEMIAFFQQIAERYPTARTITLVLDNATYNRAKLVRAKLVREWLARPECRVRLIYLPPHAPNLNLIERLWWFSKNCGGSSRRRRSGTPTTRPSPPSAQPSMPSSPTSASGRTNSHPS